MRETVKTRMELHGHNDVGHFILYNDAVPVIIDPDPETYSRLTFNEDHYALWHTRSSYHKLPLINGVEQAIGADRTAAAVSCSREGDKEENR